MSHVFGHGRLTAYSKAVEFYGLIVGMERRLARRDPCLAERLRVAAVAISMSIAGGAGASKRTRKASRYRAALGAATECSAILDLFAATCKTDAGLDECRSLLEEIATHVGALLLHATRELAPRELAPRELAPRPAQSERPRR